MISDVAKPIPLPQGVRTSITAQLRFQQNVFVSTHSNDSFALYDGRARVQDVHTATLPFVLKPFCAASNSSRTFHGVAGSSTVD